MTYKRGTTCRSRKFSSSFDVKDEVSGPNQPTRDRGPSKTCLEFPFAYDHVLEGRRRWETFIGGNDEAEHTLFYYVNGFGFHVPSWARFVLGDFVIKKGGIGVVTGNTTKKFSSLFDKDVIAENAMIIVSICLAYQRNEAHEKAKARRMRKKMIADWLKTKKTGLEHVLSDLKERFKKKEVEEQKWRESKTDEEISHLEKLASSPNETPENDDGVEETRKLNDGSIVPLSMYNQLVVKETDDVATLRVFVRRLEHKGISIFDKFAETDVYAIEQVLKHERFKAIEDESLAQQIRALKMLWMSYSFTGQTIGNLSVAREDAIPLLDAMGKPYIIVQQQMGGVSSCRSSDIIGNTYAFVCTEKHAHFNSAAESCKINGYDVIVFKQINDEARKQFNDQTRALTRANEARQRDAIRYSERVSRE